MRVVMLLGPSTGGIGTHVQQLSADLRNHGVDVIVVTHPLTARKFDLGPVEGWWPGSAGLGRGLADFRRLRRLALTADIVHAHGHQAGLLATLATLPSHPVLGLRAPERRRPKIVVSQHNTVLEDSGRQGLKRLAQRWVAARSDLSTGASRDLVEQATGFGAGRAELAMVPSPAVPVLLAQAPADRPARARLRADLLSSLDDQHESDQHDSDQHDRDQHDSYQHEAADVDRIDPDAALVVTISRIAPQKNLSVLVKAAAKLRQPCTWVVLGDGDPRLLAQLRSQARALAVPVHFIGARSPVDQWLRAAEVFVLPSQWEARALVVQEAMAAGTPVVATDVGGLRDLVGGTGLLVIPGDPAAIAAATDRILADPALRDEIAARGRDAARGLPDGSDMVTWWLARYAETLRMT